MAPLPTPLVELIAAENAMPAAPSVIAVATAARRRHGPGIAAVLFYGSCLRRGDDVGAVVDLYLLADSYQIHPGPLMRTLNWLLPPNVYYIEVPFEGRTVRAKYALLTLAQFERLVERRTLQSYFWARFAQPTVVLWARAPGVQERVTQALATAVVDHGLGDAAAARPGGFPRCRVGARILRGVPHRVARRGAGTGRRAV